MRSVAFRTPLGPLPAPALDLTEVSDVLVRIRALIALATSPNVDNTPQNLDEARNAALAAVRLIRTNGVIISLPAPAIGVTFPEPKLEVRPTKRSSKVVAASGNWKRIKAKYAGVCLKCAKIIQKDSNIFWSKIDGACHVSCFNPS